MAINYQKVGWDTTKYFNPTNMNQMDNGIKSACDKSDANEAAIADVNSKLGNTDISAIGDGTLTGGLDALNSNLIIESVEFIPSFSAYKVGHTLEIYQKLSNLEKVEYIDLGITQYKSVNDYTILPLYSTSAPYLVVGSLWIYKSGNVSLYKKSETTECFISGNYIFE